MTPNRDSRRSRLAYSILDQAISSVSNFLLLVVVIRSEDLARVGAFGVLYLFFFVILATVRGLTTEPLTVGWAGTPPGEFRKASAEAAGAVVVLSMATSALMVAVTPALPGSYRSAMLAMAVMLTPLLLQDAWRMIFFASHQPRRACVNDAAMLATQCMTFLALGLLSRPTTPTLLIAWGLSAGVGSLLGVRQTRVRPAPRRCGAWFKQTRGSGPAFALDQLVTRGSEQLALVLIAGMAGPAAAGVVTVGRTLFAPVTTLQSGLQAYAFPTISQWSQTGKNARIAPFTLWFCLSMALVFVLFGALTAALPSSLGTAIFKANWGPATSILLVMTFFSAANAMSYGVWMALRAIGDARSTFLVRLVAVPVTLACTTVGASLFGAVGGVVGMGIGACALTVTMGLLLRHRLVARI